MCGICGIFLGSGAMPDPQLLAGMMSALQHRGPDGEGFYIGPSIGLGHRRLSIIDVEGGRQPITNEDGKIQVVFNGEIYNFLELRRELETSGHRFVTRSDTEVIAHAYEEWGVSCVERFNGMFAFAVWDPALETLLLARDHLGIKPLYYAKVAGRLIFASEVKALLQDTECPCVVDVEALVELFTFRYVPSPKTLFRGILKLPPGHIMTVSARGATIKRYWRALAGTSLRAPERELAERYQDLLEDAVRLQLRSDVPLGLFLSSGIDSASLLAIMRVHSAGAMKAFTIGFEDGEKGNEVDEARQLADLFGAEHSSMFVGPRDYIEYYQRYMWDIEEPVGNETAAAFYFVSKLARRQVKVALSGQGADEPWAGYHRHLGAKFADFYSALPRWLTSSIAPMAARLFPRNERVQRGVASLSETDAMTRLVKIYSFFTAEMKHALFRDWIKSEVPNCACGAGEALRGLFSDVAQRDALTQILYIDTRSNLPDDLLMVGDKTSMATSLEARVPFLDYRLVEYIESLPPNYRLRGLQAKYLHKKALRKWLPKSVIYRRKKGFENPIGKWLATSMSAFVEEMLLSKDSSVNEFFNQVYISRLLKDHKERRGFYMRQIYLLLSFELWHRAFVRKTMNRLPSAQAAATLAPL